MSIHSCPYLLSFSTSELKWKLAQLWSEYTCPKASCQGFHFGCHRGVPSGFRGNKAILLLTKSVGWGASPIFFFSLELKCHVLIEMWTMLDLFTSVNLNWTFKWALNKVASQQVYTFISMVYWCDMIALSVTFTAKTAFYIWKMLK